jgi:hypothetical protein
MGKNRPIVKLRTYGIYTQWDRQSKELPRFQKLTTTIPAQIDIEFGLVVNVKGAKNQMLEFCIEHPGIRDDQNRVRRPFDGTVYIKTNDWNFYLGDTIWEPIADKIGPWRMWLELEGERIADKTFQVIDDPMVADRCTG